MAHLVPAAAGSQVSRFRMCSKQLPTCRSSAPAPRVPLSQLLQWRRYRLHLLHLSYPLAVQAALMSSRLEL